MSAGPWIEWLTPAEVAVCSVGSASPCSINTSCSRSSTGSSRHTAIGTEGEKGDAYAYCKRCRPGAIVRQWTRERVRGAMRAWRARYGAAPSSYDWSRTHALRRGGEALERVQAGEWPAPSTVIDLYGSWAAAVADAFGGA